MNASRSVRAAAIAAVVLAAVACGDSGDADGEATRPDGPSPARAEYVARADALCAEVLSEHPEIAEGARELRRLSPSDPGFRRKAATHFKEVLAVARSARTEFEALEPPEADRERIEQFHDANAEAVARLEDLIEALEQRADPDAAGEAYVRALAKADRLADAYGFEVCGRISGE